MPIYNQIFDSYIVNQKKINEYIKYLQSKGYVVSCKDKTYAGSK